MSSAPAGWYDDPSAPGTHRFWDGSAWAAPTARPATNPTVFSPQGTDFAPANAAPTAEFWPATTAQQHQPTREETVGYSTQYAGYQEPVAETPGVPAEEEVPWDVVGMPRKAERPVTDPSSSASWSPEEMPASRYVAPSYAPPVTKRRGMSGTAKIASVASVVVIGFVVRWAFGFFFGGDFSDDGAIGITAPADWTTYSASAPDITYAMNARWSDISGPGGINLPQPDMTLIEARALSTQVGGAQAVLVLQATSEPLTGGEADRDVFNEGFAAALDKLEASGATVLSKEDVKVYKSRAGDRWGYSEFRVSLQGNTLTIYDAVTIIDGYVLEVELLVPEGVGLTRNDLLAVANSVRER